MILIINIYKNNVILIIIYLTNMKFVTLNTT